MLTFFFITNSVPRYPGEDEKLRASSLKIRRGGNCPNSLEVLQQLAGPQDDDLRMYLVSPLPSESSPATQRVKASFGESSPVSFEHCLYRDAHTEAASSYILRSEATGSRTLVNYNDLPEMTVGEFEAVMRRFSDDDDETWWHFEVSPAAAAAACFDMSANEAVAAKSWSDSSSSGPYTRYYTRVHPQAA